MLRNNDQPGLLHLCLPAVATAALLCMALAAGAQVKLGNNITRRDSSAALEIESQRQVLLLPRINDTGTIVKTVKDGALIYYNNVPGGGIKKGLYLRSSNKWNYLWPSTASGWVTTGNAGTNRGANFLGTTDNQSLLFKTNNITRMVIDGATGYTGLGTLTPQASLHNAGGTVLDAVSMGNYPSGVIGPAASTVDKFTTFRMQSTSGGSTAYILSSPTDITPGRIAYVINYATTNTGMTMISNANSAGVFQYQAVMMVWNGTYWMPVQDTYSTNGDFGLIPYRTSPSLMVGQGAGSSATGLYNTGLGYNALNALTTGTGNVGIGGFAGTSTQNYSVNIMCTYGVGLNGGYGTQIKDGTVAVGPNAAYGNSTLYNIAVGYQCLQGAFGQRNTVIGTLAAATGNLFGTQHALLGYKTASSAYGLGIAAAGSQAYGLTGTSAHLYTSALGFRALNSDGSSASTPGSGVFSYSAAIGAFAQVVNNQRAIVLGAASTTAYASNVGIGLYSPSYKVHVNGKVKITGTFSFPSDGRLKRSIAPVEKALGKMMAIHGVSYRWKTALGARLHLSMDSLKHLGFLAQELEKIVPEAVHTGKDSMQLKTVAYAELMPLFTAAFQQQEPLLNDLQQQAAALNRRMARLQHIVSELEKQAAALP